MARIDVDQIYEVTKEHYNKAKNSLTIVHRALYESASAISDTIPGYKADFLEFGSYAKDNFTVLFVDMRNSTKRAEKLGAEKTFLSMHAYIPALLQVVECYQGKVVDIMGDGIMVFFGGRSSGMAKNLAVQNAGLCGKDMLCVREKVINPILKEDDIDMYVISNTTKANGASVIVYSDALQQVAENLGSDLYILPSSIHEVLALPVGNKDVDSLEEMVRCVNQTEVSPTEVLSDNVYKYDAESRTLSLASAKAETVKETAVCEPSGYTGTVNEVARPRHHR